MIRLSVWFALRGHDNSSSILDLSLILYTLPTLIDNFLSHGCKKYIGFDLTFTFSLHFKLQV